MVAIDGERFGAFIFDLDGVVARTALLHGKPAPDIFLEPAHRLGVEPAQAVVCGERA